MKHLILAPAGDLTPGDVIQSNRGVVGVVRAAGPSKTSGAVPSWPICVSWGGADPVLEPALPWDEVLLLAQAIDAEVDVEREP